MAKAQVAKGGDGGEEREMTLLTNRVAGVIAVRGGEVDGEMETGREVTAMRGGAGGTGRRRRIMMHLIEQKRQP